MKYRRPSASCSMLYSRVWTVLTSTSPATSAKVSVRLHWILNLVYRLLPNFSGSFTWNTNIRYPQCSGFWRFYISFIKTFKKIWNKLDFLHKSQKILVRIRIRIQIRWPGIRIRGSGSVPKSHGSETPITLKHTDVSGSGFDEFGSTTLPISYQKWYSIKISENITTKDKTTF